MTNQADLPEPHTTTDPPEPHTTTDLPPASQELAAFMDKLPTPSQVLERVKELRRLMLTYRFGLEEVHTKIQILRDEYHHIHDYNPIEHVGTRLKTLESLLSKARRRNVAFDAESIKANIYDIAGIRITCPFVTDIYLVRDALTRQLDLEVLEERDYIQNPKPNGYKSLHLILRVPVFLSDRVEQVTVEVQLRTIAMDFWASTEHKIYYKYSREVPRHLTDALKLAADVAWTLDTSMEDIHNQMKMYKSAQDDVSTTTATSSVEEMLSVYLRMAENPPPPKPQAPAAD